MIYKFPNAVINLIKAFQEHGFEAYVVGGAVRDILLKENPHDYDIATSATPAEAVALAKEQGWQTIDNLGRNFGTVIIVVKGMGFEVTTFRGERYDKDSHRPAEIWKARNLQEDCQRRDFTINAMAMDLNGIIYDFHGGRQDLAKGILRTVGPAGQRFEEDALRMFRACRFVAEHGFRYVDEKGRTKAFGAAGTPYYLPECPVFATERCEGLSVERVKAELEKLICGDFAGLGLAMLAGSGLAGTRCQVKRNGETKVIDVLPEVLHLVGLHQNPKFHQYDVWEHTLKAVDNGPQKLPIRWALVCHDLGKGLPGVRDLNKEGQPRDAGHERQSALLTAELLQRLNYAPKFVKYVVFLVDNHMRFAGFMRQEHEGKSSEDGMLHWLRLVVSQNLFKHESDLAEAVTDLVKVYLADMGATVAGGNSQIMEEGRELGARLIQLARTRMPVSTGDLHLNSSDFAKFPPEVKIKTLLLYLLHRVQNGEIPNERNVLLRAIEVKLRRMKGAESGQVAKNKHANRAVSRKRRRGVSGSASGESGAAAAGSGSGQ